MDYSNEDGIQSERRCQPDMSPAAAEERAIEEKTRKHSLSTVVSSGSALASASASASADHETKQLQLPLPHRMCVSVRPSKKVTNPECKVHDQLVQYTDFEEDVKLIDEGAGEIYGFRDCAEIIALYAGRHIILPMPLTRDVLKNSLILRKDDAEKQFLAMAIGNPDDYDKIEGLSEEDFRAAEIGNNDGFDEKARVSEEKRTEYLVQTISDQFRTCSSPLTLVLAMETFLRTGDVKITATHDRDIDQWRTRPSFQSLMLTVNTVMQASTVTTEAIRGPDIHDYSNCAIVAVSSGWCEAALICPLCYVDLQMLDEDERPVNPDHKSCMRMTMEPRITRDEEGRCDRPVLGSYVRVPSAVDISFSAACMRRKSKEGEDNDDDDDCVKNVVVEFPDSTSSGGG